MLAERAAAVRARREVGEYIRATTSPRLLTSCRSMPEPERRCGPGTPAGAAGRPGSRIGSVRVVSSAVDGVAATHGNGCSGGGSAPKRRQTGGSEHAAPAAPLPQQLQQVAGLPALDGGDALELLPVDMKVCARLCGNGRRGARQQSVSAGRLG